MQQVPQAHRSGTPVLTACLLVQMHRRRLTQTPTTNASSPIIPTAAVIIASTRVCPTRLSTAAWQ